MAQNPNYYGSGMSFYDNPTTGQNFYDATFNVTTLTGRPVIGDPSYGAWCEARAQYLASLAAVTTGQTTYYFDPVGGSDANSGLTTLLPKQTLSAANTLLAAKNCRILFKRGTKDVSGTGLTVSAASANVSIGSYGTGRRCQFMTAVVAQACGASWTSSTGAYYMTRAAASKVAGVREQGNNYRFYAQTSTVAECRALAGSFFHDTGANRLYVRHYMDFDLTNASDPCVLEIFPESSANGFFVDTGVGSVWVDGVEFVGYGALSDATQNAKYGIHSSLTGSDTLLVTDCAAIFNNNHNIGAEQGITTGGRIVIIGCEAGFLTQPGTVFVGHAASGGQEIYMVDCDVVGGNLLRIASGVPNYVCGTSQASPWLAHTDSGGGHNPSFCCAVRMRCFGGQMMVGSLGAAADCVAATDPANIVSVNVDCEFGATPPQVKDSTYRPADTAAKGTCPYQVTGGNPVDGVTTAYINCTWNVRPPWMGSTVDVINMCDTWGGLHINGLVLMDGSYVAPGDRTRLLTIGLVDDAAQMTGAFHNCHFHIYGVTYIEAGLVTRSACSLTTGNSHNPTKLHFKDNIFTIDANVSANYYFGAGNNHDAAGAAYSPSRVVNLAHNMPTNTDTSRGWNAVTGTVTQLNAWKPGKRPKVGDIDAVQQPMLSSSYYVRHDRSWKVRRSGTTAMGPVEAQ